MTRPFEPDPDLDALVRQLNHAARSQAVPDDVAVESPPVAVPVSNALPASHQLGPATSATAKIITDSTNTTSRKT